MKRHEIQQYWRFVATVTTGLLPSQFIFVWVHVTEEDETGERLRQHPNNHSGKVFKGSIQHFMVQNQRRVWTYSNEKPSILQRNTNGKESAADTQKWQSLKVCFSAISTSWLTGSRWCCPSSCGCSPCRVCWWSWRWGRWSRGTWSQS